MAKTIFNQEKVDFTKQNMFFGADMNTQRYDTFRFPVFDKLNQTMLGYFWRPEEVSLQKDRADFANFRPEQKHIFTSNLKYQTLLDSVQGRGPCLAFLPHVSLPELEGCIVTWDFFETIHSRSYTHIIRNVYSNPSKIFDEMMDVQQIADCAGDISKYYDDLITMSSWYNLLGVGTHTVNGEEVVVDLYELKKLLWLTLMSVNILEGVRFYVSFACSWAFAELKKMEGNAKIIKLIARDENLHLASTQMLLKVLKQDDPDFIKIAEETEDECIQMFVDAVDQEKAWAEYLFKDGSMIGLNTELLNGYIEFICQRRMNNVNLKCPYTKVSNPLPWTNKWISGAEVQVAPQETEITSYVSGGTKQDVSTDTFKGFSL